VVPSTGTLRGLASGSYGYEVSRRALPEEHAFSNLLAELFSGSGKLLTESLSGGCLYC